MKFIALVFLLAGFVACSAVPSQIEPVPAVYLDKHGNLKADLVLALSAAVANKHGVNVDDYNPPTLTKEGAVWWVFFESKNSCFGCHFSVSINEIELTSMYSPGR